MAHNGARSSSNGHPALIIPNRKTRGIKVIRTRHWVKERWTQMKIQFSFLRPDTFSKCHQQDRVLARLFGLRLHMVAAGNRVFGGLPLCTVGGKSYFSEAMNRRRRSRMWGRQLYTLQLDGPLLLLLLPRFFPPSPLSFELYIPSIGFYPFRVTQRLYTFLFLPLLLLEFQPA